MATTTPNTPSGPTRRGQCTNFGNCSIADARRPVDVPAGQDFVCEECGKSLMLAGAEGSSLRRILPALVVGAIAVVLLVVLGVNWLRGRQAPDATASAPASTAPATSRHAAGVSPSLRLAGSNTLGSQLVPDLVEAWLRAEGATRVDRAPGTVPAEMTLTGHLAGGATKTVSIAAHGSATAFTALADNTADIGMASRRAHADEVDRLKAIGDLLGPASEHVVGLDGLAVIVHKSNPVTMLDKNQVAAIFTGRVTDWRQLGTAARGKSGPITVLARDDKSGTWDTFQHLVLGTAQLVAGAKRLEDSAALSDAVAADADAIGFIGLPFVRNARALAIAEPGAVALLPTRFTVATEDYPLSRRLYLYTGAASSNPDVTKFVEFAKSRAGQEVVARDGFIEQTVRPQAADEATVSDQAPAEYRRLTANATRLSLNFRFRTGSADLDNKALPDLDRVVQFLGDMHTSPDAIQLFGFADSRGGAALNQQLSRERARAVADAFRQRGVNPGVVTGFGSAMPVASNDTPEGQEKNRRVEIWVRR